MARKTFKDFIGESAAITADNIQQFAGTKNSNLSDRVEFKNIEKLDPVFAKKLLIAWEGDAHEYSKKKEFESLFMKMVKPDAVRKLSKIDVNQAVIKDLDKLLALHSQSFHQKEKPLGSMNNDIWSHVGMKRAYESLQEEVASILCE
jgi:hypothetical protein